MKLWLFQDFLSGMEKFFDSSLSKEIGTIERLSGVDSFRKQIMSGAREKEIRASWEPGLSDYK